MNEINPPGNENAEEISAQPQGEAPVRTVIPAQPQGEPPIPPAPVSKPKTSAGFFILGFLAALVFYGVLMAIVFSLYTPSGNAGGTVGTFLIVLVDFAVFLAMLISGRKSGKVKLASLGKGGVWACVAVPLVLLLTVGSCLLLVSP